MQSLLTATGPSADPLMRVSLPPARSPLFAPSPPVKCPALAAATASATLYVPTVDSSVNPGQSDEVLIDGEVFISAPLQPWQTINAPGAASPYDFSFPSATPNETALRHREWQYKRNLIYASMERCHFPRARLARFWDCGSGCTVHENPKTGDIKTRAYYCHDRNCDPCARARAGVIKRNVEDKLQTGHYLHIMLSLRSTDEPLGKEARRLYKAFRKLRSKARWKEWCTGGAAFFETTYNEGTGQFHPHLHIAAEAHFIPHAELSALWLQCTGDSDYVWLRPITSAHALAEEVAKYASKPMHASLFYDQNVTDQAMMALRSIRLCTTFGSWRGLKLTAKPKAPSDEGWIFLGRLDEIIAQAKAGHPRSLVILRAVLCKNRKAPKVPPPSRSQSP